MNTRYFEKTKDFKLLEEDLNEFFEKDFSEHLSIVKGLFGKSNINEKENNALYCLARYGVIGDMRTPRHKKAMDDALWEGLGKLIPNCTPELKGGLEEVFAYRQEVKYSNFIEYSDISERILETMGGLIFKIIVPKNNSDYFVVPDCSSVTIRDKINSYFNPDVREIAYIGVPLTSKMYIHFFSEKLFKENFPSSEIEYEETAIIDKINKASFDVCQNKVACENRDYLVKFVEKIESSAL